MTTKLRFCLFLGTAVGLLWRANLAWAQCDGTVCIPGGSGNPIPTDGVFVDPLSSDRARPVFQYSPGRRLGEEVTSSIAVSGPIPGTGTPEDSTPSRRIPVEPIVNQSTAQLPTETLISEEGRQIGSKPGFGLCSGSCGRLPQDYSGPPMPMSTAFSDPIMGDHLGLAKRNHTDPVNPDTGEFIHESDDVTLPGTNGLNFQLKRTYRSRVRFDGPFGTAWDHSFNQYVHFVIRPVPNPDGARSKTSFPVRWSRGNGTSIELNAGRVKVTNNEVEVSYSATGFFEGTFVGTFTKESFPEPKGWRIILPDGRITSFDASGYLASIATAEGSLVKVIWKDSAGSAKAKVVDQVVDSVNRTIVFGYDELGRLKDVREQTIGVLSEYRYDLNGRLFWSKTFSGHSESYEYDSRPIDSSVDEYVPEPYLATACDFKCGSGPDRFSAESENLCGAASYSLAQRCEVAYRTCDQECQTGCSSGCTTACTQGCESTCNVNCTSPIGKERVAKACSRLREFAEDLCGKGPCRKDCTQQCGTHCDNFVVCGTASAEGIAGCAGFQLYAQYQQARFAWAGAKDLTQCIGSILGLSKCDTQEIRSEKDYFCNDTCMTCCTNGDDCGTDSCQRGVGCEDECLRVFDGKDSRSQCGSSTLPGCLSRLTAACQPKCAEDCSGRCINPCKADCSPACSALCEQKYLTGCTSAENFQNWCGTGCVEACVAANRAVGSAVGKKYGFRNDLIGNLTKMYDGEGELVLTNLYGEDLSDPSFDAVKEQRLGNPSKGEASLRFSYQDLTNDQSFRDDYESVQSCVPDSGGDPFPPISRGRGSNGPGPIPDKRSVISDPFGARHTYYFSRSGLLLREINQDTGAARSYQYDDQARLIGIEEPLRNRVCLTYDDRSLVTNVYRIPVPGDVGITFARYTSMAYTPFPARLKSVSERGEKVWRRFTWDGPRLVSSDDVSGVTTYTLDAKARPTLAVRQDGRRIRTQYEGALPSVVTYEADTQDALSAEFKFDEAGRPTQRTSPLGARTTYAWKNGLVDSITVSDARGSGKSATIGLLYNGNGRLKTATHQHTGLEESFTYDAFGYVRTHERRGTRGTPVVVTTSCFLNGPDGRILEAVLPEGNRLRYAYDPEGRLKSVSKGFFESSPLSWDDQCTKPVAPGLTATLLAFTYDVGGRVLSESGPTGDSTFYTYGGYSQPTIIEHPNGLIEHRGYDFMGSPTWAARYAKTAPPYKRPTSVQANLVSYVDVDWFTIGVPKSILEWHFDKDGKLIGDGIKATEFIDVSAGRLEVSTEGRRVIEQTDTLGRITAMTAANGAIESYLYSEGGRKVDRSWLAANGFQVQTTYLSALGLLEKVEEPTIGGTRTSQWDYDATGLLLHSFGDAQPDTTIIPDALGRPRLVTTKIGTSEETSTYEWTGNDTLKSLTSVTNGVTGVHTWQRDMLDRVSSTTYPDNRKDEVFTFLEASELPLTGAIRASSFSRQYVAGQLTQEDLQQGSAKLVKRFTYDTLGRLTFASRSSGSAKGQGSFEYDSLGNLTADYTATPSGSLAANATFDVFGNKKTATFDGEAIAFGHDLNNRLRCATARMGSSFSCFFYDVEGGISGVQDPTWRTDSSGTSTIYERTSSGALQTLSIRTGTTTNRSTALSLPEAASWRWGLNGLDELPRSISFRSSSVAGGGRGSAFELDSGGRLIGEGHGLTFGGTTGPTDDDAAASVLSSASRRREYVLDGRHNWTNVSSETAIYPSAYDGSDRPTAIVGQTITYGPNGTAARLGETTFVSDLDGQVVAAKRGDQTFEFIRDGLGRVLEIADSSGNQASWGYHGTARVVVKETTDGQPPATRILVPGGRLDEVLFTLRGSAVHQVQQGGDLSWLGVVDGGGKLAERYEYTAYGERGVYGPGDQALSVSGVGVGEGFQGRPYLVASFGNANLYDFRARSYLPFAGRFVEQDPVGLLGGLNAYAFVGSSPLKYLDPFGLAPQQMNVADGVRRSWIGPDTQSRTFGRGLIDRLLTFMNSLPPGTGQPTYLPMSESQQSALNRWIAVQPEDPRLFQAKLRDFVRTTSGLGPLEEGLSRISIDPSDPYAWGSGLVDVGLGATTLASWGGVARGPLASYGNATGGGGIPGRLARVIPGDVTPTALGRPGPADVFVTAADDIAGMTSPAQIAERLTIPQSKSFTVIEFATPAEGLASPVFRTNPGFIGGGRTAGGAREFVVPNMSIPPGATVRRVGP